MALSLGAYRRSQERRPGEMKEPSPQNPPRQLKEWGEFIKLLLELAIALAGLVALLHKLL